MPGRPETNTHKTRDIQIDGS